LLEALVTGEPLAIAAPLADASVAHPAFRVNNPNMGSVNAYESAKGRRYRARWRDDAGRQHERRGFATMREAKRYVTSAEAWSTGRTTPLPNEARIAILELATDWLANKEQALKPSSFAPIRNDWRVYVAPRCTARARREYSSPIAAPRFPGESSTEPAT